MSNHCCGQSCETHQTNLGSTVWIAQKRPTSNFSCVSINWSSFFAKLVIQNTQTNVHTHKFTFVTIQSTASAEFPNNRKLGTVQRDTMARFNPLAAQLLSAGVRKETGKRKDNLWGGNDPVRSYGVKRNILVSGRKKGEEEIWTIFLGGKVWNVKSLWEYLCSYYVRKQPL